MVRLPDHDEMASYEQPSTILWVIKSPGQQTRMNTKITVIILPDDPGHGPGDKILPGARLFFSCPAPAMSDFRRVRLSPDHKQPTPANKQIRPMGAAPMFDRAEVLFLGMGLGIVVYC